jgi:hypothetical protein
MRTYKDIYKDYTDWLVIKNRDDSYSYRNLVEKYGENNTDIFLYKDLLKKFYDEKDGFFYFAKFLIGPLTDIGYPKPFRYNGLLLKWNKLLENHTYIAILCARGHGKSVFFSQVRNIYDLFLYKYRRMILISASQEQADELLENMKIIIENNEWLATKRDGAKWATQRIGYNKGYVMTAGIGTEILGQHVDRIVVDDILRSDNKLTDRQIEDYIDMNLMPMLLNREGQIVIVGTPKSETDIFTAIKNRIRDNKLCPWALREYPAILDYDNKILQCPDRFTWDQLMEKRLTMGALKFGREYQLEFFSRDASLFPRVIVDPAKEKGKDFKILNHADKRDPNWSFFIGVDVARSGAASADFTVAIVLAYNSINQTKQIVNMWREKGLKMTEQANQIAQISRDFDHATVLVEQNNMGQDMIDELADKWNVTVESFVTGGKGQKKDELIRGLISAFEHEQIIIPQGDEWSIEQMTPLLDELDKFCTVLTPAGNEQFRGMGSHDDIVIALALANKATQVIGAPFAITDFGKMPQNAYQALLNTRSSNQESDLMKLIRMGVIK